VAEFSGEPRAFYLDEGIPYSAARIGRNLGLDVVAASEAGATPRPDREHLATAAADERVLVTYNRNDFIEETRDAFAAGKQHFGVLILTHKLPGDGARIAHALVRWAAERPPLQPYGIDFLSD
jgi:predicted nuclease of predicted toxin-antitoxin system